MPTYIGENKIIDRYLGDKFLEAAYIGDKKVYDPYTEITGYLPVIFKSRATVALKNYRIYGTSAGAGVETENLWDESWVKGIYSSVGAYISRPSAIASDPNKPIPVQGGTTYYIKQFKNVSKMEVFFYSRATAGFISYDTIVPDVSNSFVTPQSATYMRFDCYRGYGTVYANDIVISTALPTAYVPHGYKLPLTVESGAQSQDIPIYIGSSKLGEEEYVDFGEQKVYKYAEPLKIYGWHVDPSISDPANAITYLGDAIGKTPATMGAETFSYGDWSDAFFMPKPCMLKSDGTVDYYLDPNDYTKKADGTASDIADQSYDGNAMMEWPLIWWKYEAGETEDEGYFYVSNRKVDDSFNCWCNYNCDDKIVSHFYTAIYNGTGTSKMRSISGVTLTSAKGNGGTTATQEITRAEANNTTDKTEWYIDVWSDRMLINGLLILMGKSLNSQAVFGRGLDTGSQSAKEAYVTGSLNDKGLFWGNTSAGTSGVKVFGMENYWGCVWHRTAGLIGLSNGNTAYKLTYGTADGTTADSYNTNGNGYLIDSTARPASGYFKTAKFGKFGYLPLTMGGSSTTYFADHWYTNNSALTFALVGGNANAGVHDGCSYFNLNNTPGGANWHISSSLSFKPLAKTVPKPDLISTDPPVPLPPIPTYKGENTLSSTETLGEATIKGRINELPNTP